MPAQHSAARDLNQVVQSANDGSKFATSSTKVQDTAVFNVSGITCSGCIGRIESQMLKVSGLHSISVNTANHRAFIVYDSGRLSLPQLTQYFDSIGYPAQPYQTRDQESKLDTERKSALTRILVAAALGMQVMMIATALYFGGAFGIDQTLQNTLEYVALFLSVPIMVFCAFPFFANAVKNLKNRQLGMDVPVCLALLAAFAGSLWSTIGNSGQIYYESIAMFVFLLLSARFLELSARRRSFGAIFSAEKSIPETAARLLHNERSEIVSVTDLLVGDRIVIQPGEIVPADSIVESGLTTADESILTGESAPITKKPGDNLLAGSICIEGQVIARVCSFASDSTISRIIELTEAAQVSKSKTTLLADRIAGYFVFGVLVLALVAGISWWMIDRSIWLGVVISTLVIACPCALSLATPTAFVAAMGNLTRRGIMPVKSGFFEESLKVKHLVFDKTGTLTTGEPRLVNICPIEQYSQQEALAVAASLNQYSKHPFARVLNDAVDDSCSISRPKIKDIEPVTGSGIIGRYENAELILGSKKFIQQRLGIEEFPFELRENLGSSYSFLAIGDQIVASFEFEDKLREDAAPTITRLQAMGYSLSILSGDSQSAVSKIAEQSGIREYYGELSPTQKLESVKKLKDKNKGVAVIGDGLNDAPMAALADFSIAMGNASDLTQLQSDVILTSHKLADIVEIIELAARTRKIVKQNLLWALGYNLLAVPAAMIGMVPPWLAAIGMSGSSLLVSGNASRLSRSR